MLMDFKEFFESITTEDKIFKNCLSQIVFINILFYLLLDFDKETLKNIKIKGLSMIEDDNFDGIIFSCNKFNDKLLNEIKTKSIFNKLCAKEVEYKYSHLKSGNYKLKILSIR